MRLIDADAFITREKELYCKGCDSYNGVKCRACWVDDILGDLDDYADAYTMEVPRWIPVTEMLPELLPCTAGTAYSEAVVVWTTGRKALTAIWDGDDFIADAGFWGAEDEIVTHWMPLPQPPKEGDT